MRLKRVLRDCVILALAFAGLLLVFNVFRLWDQSNQTEHPDRQSRTRQLADLAFRRENWNQAHEHYVELTKQDPYNGYAWYMAGICLWNQSYLLQDALAGELKSEVADQAKVDSLRAQLFDIGQRALDSLEYSLNWSRYRNPSRVAMAAINTTLDRHDQAIDILSSAIQDGYFRRAGLQAPEFDPLRNDPRFQEILHQESPPR
ncbi:MAG TPA: hypothetical protein PKD54_12345 [Pirellulaceae bacterium]|nr:hypothetical protein [Pirellulaceae bacterium]